MRNSDADVSGPPIPDNESEGSDVSDIDIKPDSEGWEDLEEDTEEVAIQCLLCDQKFAKVQTMVKDHCKASHNFDLLEVRQKLDLDFYATIKLVNYIRSEVLSGHSAPDVSNPEAWADDKYLQPALTDDALLFSLDELDESGQQDPI